MTAEPDDDLLIARAQQGETDAFADLVRRHQRMIAGLLHRFTSSHAELEDLVQETFIRAHRHLPDWTPQKPFVHWLRRVAVNIGRDHCRARARRPEHLELPPSDMLPDSTPPQTASSAANEVREILALLQPDDCTLLTLHYLEGLPLAEVGELLGWSVINTKVRSFRARQKLHTLLTRYGYTP